MKTSDTQKDIFTMLATDAVINQLQRIVKGLAEGERMKVEYLESNLKHYCFVMLEVLGIKLKLPKRDLRELDNNMGINSYLRNQYLNYFQKILSFFQKELLTTN